MFPPDYANFIKDGQAHSKAVHGNDNVYSDCAECMRLAEEVFIKAGIPIEAAADQDEDEFGTLVGVAKEILRRRAGEAPDPLHAMPKEEEEDAWK